MRALAGALVMVSLLASAPAFPQVAPEWLRELGSEATDTSEPAARARPPVGAEAAATTPPRRWPAEAGPFIEETVVTGRDAQTVEQRESARALQRPSSPTVTRAAPSSPTDVDAHYGVQPGDVLQISVWREPELQREVTVSPDGRINYPLIGSLPVEDKSVEEIGADIEAGLSRFMNQAAVTVTVKELVGNRVYVIGQVNRPGVFPFTKSLDVVQALSLAGGTAKFAELDDIKILRRVGGVQKAYAFNYTKVQNGRDLEQNILLESGDVIVVP